MTIITILVIIGVIIFFFLRDRDKMLATTVDSHGGMRQKYATLIQWLTSDPHAVITNVTRDHVKISCIMTTTAAYFSITESFQGVKIEWETRLGIMGNHNLEWEFPNHTPQHEMIEQIGNDLNTYENKIYN